ARTRPEGRVEGAVQAMAVPAAGSIATQQGVGAAPHADPDADLASMGCSARAARTMSSAVRNASVSRWTEKTASPAARRNNMTASAVLVWHGTTRRRAQAR